MYKKIQVYWNKNGKAIMTQNMLEVDVTDPQTRLIKEEVINQLAAEIDYQQIYKDVFKLYGTTWNQQLDDIELSMKKLDFKFQHSQSSSQQESALGFKKYV